MANNLLVATISYLAKSADINYDKLSLLLSHLAVICMDSIAKLNFTHARVVKGNGFVRYVKRITQLLNWLHTFLTSTTEYNKYNKTRILYVIFPFKYSIIRIIDKIFIKF